MGIFDRFINTDRDDIDPLECQVPTMREVRMKMGIPKTPEHGVSDAHAERLKREQKITKTVYGGSHVERPKRTDAPQLPKIPNYNPNEPIKSEVPEFRPKPMKKDIMKEIEWEYSEEGAKELRHLFAMWHLNDEVWQMQRRKAINLAVYGEEDPFNAKPYYHIISFSDDYGFKITQYPKHQKEEAHKLFNSYNEAWHTPNNILFFEGEEIGHIILGGKV